MFQNDAFQTVQSQPPFPAMQSEEAQTPANAIVWLPIYPGQTLIIYAPAPSG